MQRAVLTDVIVVTEVKQRVIASEMNILRPTADRGSVLDGIAMAHPRGASDEHVRT